MNAIELSAKDLYAGLEARRVLLDGTGGKLLLDARIFKIGKDKDGRVVTDVIDLVGEELGIANGLAGASAVEAVLDAELPEGASAKVETRSGASFFDQSGWSEWKDLGGLKGRVEGLKGRYFQVRIALKAEAADKLPAVSALKLVPERYVQKMALIEPLHAVESRVQKIVRSTVDFQHERPDQAKLVKFREAARLDEVVAGKFDDALRGPEQKKLDEEVMKASGAGEDFLQLVRLMDWTGSCFNSRDKDKVKDTYKKPGYYDWDIDNVWRLEEVEENGEKKKRPTIYGHCMSYSEVLVTAASAMGYKGRHLSVVGVSERSHEVCEIWVPSLGKWVYFDPSLSNYYFDKEKKTPLCILEMHRIIVDNFVPEGKDMHWFIVRHSNEVKDHVKKAGGGQKPIGSRLGKWKYGAPMPADYDWGWSHGYMTAGFVQMTPRNDFNSNPKANPKRFEYLPGYAGYPNWADERTPPKKGGENYVTRLRDFYWTLDQASFKLTRTDEDTVSVELGNSMPFFKKYLVKVDGREAAGAANPFVWKLKPGENRLEVAPVDEFGKTGQASSVTVRLGK